MVHEGRRSIFHHLLLINRHDRELTISGVIGLRAVSCRISHGKVKVLIVTGKAFDLAGDIVLRRLGTVGLAGLILRGLVCQNIDQNRLTIVNDHTIGRDLKIEVHRVRRNQHRKGHMGLNAVRSPADLNGSSCQASVFLRVHDVQFTPVVLTTGGSDRIGGPIVIQHVSQRHNIFCVHGRVGLIAVSCIQMKFLIIGAGHDDTVGEGDDLALTVDRLTGLVDQIELVGSGSTLPDGLGNGIGLGGVEPVDVDVVQLGVLVGGTDTGGLGTFQRILQIDVVVQGHLGLGDVADVPVELLIVLLGRFVPDSGISEMVGIDGNGILIRISHAIQDIFGPGTADDHIGVGLGSVGIECDPFQKLVLVSISLLSKDRRKQNAVLILLAHTDQSLINGVVRMCLVVVLDLLLSPQLIAAHLNGRDHSVLEQVTVLAVAAGLSSHLQGELLVDDVGDIGLGTGVTDLGGEL